MSSTTSLRCVAVLLLFSYACGKGAAEDSYVRGHGVKAARLSIGAEAQIVEAAIHASFDADPALKLRVHPRRLPRTAGDSGGNLVSSVLVRTLRDKGLVLGTCDPIRNSPRDTPRCPGPEAGYVIRPSEVFTLTHDTLEVYFGVEKFGAATGQKPEALRFEKVYKLVRQGAGWRVAREGRAKD
ncbi:MAG: hypothetical protein ABI625_13585 [bacterium]